MSDWKHVVEDAMQEASATLETQNPNRFTWCLSVSFMVCYIVLSRPICALFWPSLLDVAQPELTPALAALYAAVSTSGLVNAVHAATLRTSADVLGTKQATQDAMVSSAMLGMMYLRKLLTLGVVVIDPRGMTVDPMHYVLWACSAPGVAAIPAHIASAPSCVLWRARLGALGCMVFATLALALPPTWHYTLMLFSTLSMADSLRAQLVCFRLLYKAPLLNDRHRQWVTWSGMLTVLAWCGFPIIWVLESFGPQRSTWVEVGYCFVDIAAKLLSTTMLTSGYMQRLDRAKCIQALHKYGSATEQVTSLNAAVAARQAVLRFILHEIRVPLNGIAIATDIIQDYFRTHKPDHLLRSALRACNTNMGQISSILNDSLDVERVEAGKLQLSSRRVPVDLLFGECTASFPDADVNLFTSVKAGTPVKFSSDGARLLQVLRNLLSNALKFAPPKSNVVIECETVIVSKFVMDCSHRIITRDFLSAKAWTHEGSQPKPSPVFPAWTKIAAQSHNLTDIVVSDESALEELVKDELKHSDVVDESTLEFSGPWELRSTPQNAVEESSSSGNIHSASVRSRRASTVPSAQRAASTEVSGLWPRGPKDPLPFILCRSLESPDTEVLRISVRDEGCGMALEELKRLFHPFSQPKQSSTIGSGLGLLISRVLVTILGGRLGVTSAPDIGTRFFVLLPVDRFDGRVPVSVASPAAFFRSSLAQVLGNDNSLSPSTSDSSSAASSKGDGSNGKESKLSEALLDTVQEEGISTSPDRPPVPSTPIRVLVVDDALETRKLLNMLLRRLKCRTVLASDGIDCLGKLKEDQEFDLILLDHEMPRLSGSETAQEIRRLYPDIFIVGLTGHSYEDDRNMLLKHGTHRVYSKPIRKADLEKVLEEVQQRRIKGADNSGP